MRLFLKRQVWIWEQGTLVSGEGLGRNTAEQRRKGPHLIHCTCCQFWAAALRLSHVGQWQRHGLQASVLLQSLSHVQQAQSRRLVPVPGYRPRPGGASAEDRAQQGPTQSAGLVHSPSFSPAP